MSGNCLERAAGAARKTACCRSPPSAASLWLGLRVERRLGRRTAELSYADQLRRRFPGSSEAQALQRGGYE